VSCRVVQASCSGTGKRFLAQQTKKVLAARRAVGEWVEWSVASTPPDISPLWTRATAGGLYVPQDKMI
jgi:hypothetical protein